MQNREASVTTRDSLVTGTNTLCSLRQYLNDSGRRAPKLVYTPPKKVIQIDKETSEVLQLISKFKEGRLSTPRWFAQKCEWICKINLTIKQWTTLIKMLNNDHQSTNSNLRTIYNKHRLSHNSLHKHSLYKADEAKLLTKSATWTHVKWGHRETWSICHKEWTNKWEFKMVLPAPRMFKSIRLRSTHIKLDESAIKFQNLICFPINPPLLASLIPHLLSGCQECRRAIARRLVVIMWHQKFFRVRLILCPKTQRSMLHLRI